MGERASCLTKTKDEVGGEERDRNIKRKRRRKERKIERKRDRKKER